MSLEKVSSKLAWTAAFFLTAINTYSFADRQLPSIMIPELKAELLLTDAQIGFLFGTVFAIFFGIATLIFGRLADTQYRKNVLIFAILMWSVLTGLCGIAQQFWDLIIFRIGVGVGEAGCSPPAHSMIADYFPANKRSTALGIYSLGIPFGIMFGLFAGGWINEVFGWRLAFFVVGIPGILLAFIFRFTVKEPIRGQAEGKIDSENQPSIFETISYLVKKRSFRHLVFAAALAAFVGYGAITWLPSFFQRSYGMQTSDVGWYLGLILGIPGGLGIFLGGYLSDYFGAKNVKWSLWVAAIAMALTVPFNVYVYLSPTATMSFLWLIIPVALGNFYQAATFSQTQGLVELRMRSVAAAILLFIINIIGLGFGPQSVGILSDLLHSEYGKDSLRYSLLIFAFLKLWCAFHYYMAGKYLKEDLIKN